MEKTTRRKRIPYGMMNFIDVREDNCYYVDKTRFIPMIEDANKYFFLYPSPTIWKESDGIHASSLL